jgi:hypothetical protein
VVDWNLVSLGIGLAEAYVFYRLGRRDSKQSEKLLHEIKDAVEKGKHKPAFSAEAPVEAKARPAGSDRASRPRQTGRGVVQGLVSYRGVSLNYADSSRTEAGRWRDKWTQRARIGVGAVFLLVLSPWLISFWLLRWNIGDLAILSFDWYEFPPVRSLIDDLSNFELWGFWVLVILLVSEAVLTWLHGRWKAWAFLHPLELRLYDDGTCLAVSEERVTPSRALIFVERHSVLLTCVVILVGTAWYWISPYTQLPPTAVSFSAVDFAAFFPIYMLVVMTFWASVRWGGTVVLAHQLHVLDLHEALIKRLRSELRRTEG